MLNRREMNRILALAAGALAAGAAQAFGADALGEELQNQDAANKARRRSADSIGVKYLQREPLPKMEDPELRMLTLTVAPGATSMPHRHTGPVFAYILEGSVENQVEPEPPKTYRAGDFFYEPSMHVHRELKNLSATEPAKILVVEVGEKGKTFTIDAMTAK